MAIVFVVSIVFNQVQVDETRRSRAIPSLALGWPKASWRYDRYADQLGSPLQPHTGHRRLMDGLNFSMLNQHTSLPLHFTLILFNGDQSSIQVARVHKHPPTAPLLGKLD